MQSPWKTAFITTGVFWIFSAIPAYAENQTPTINANIEFRVSSPDLKKINGARVLVISDKGTIMANGLTNSEGIWNSKLQVTQDPRFSNIREMGTVTAILFAQGYNEEVVFEVPVYPNSIQPVSMVPIQPGKRNEPVKWLGNLHRHDIGRMVDRYANETGLAKQPGVSGTFGNAAWSPSIKR